MYDTTDNTGKTKGDSKIIRIDEQEIRSHRPSGHPCRLLRQEASNQSR